ncbi:uro-adherence factor A [Amia ocellicauda]|uniref:uro-adherence factor A n=1 Tax=Amia ocellicauda TaxID=2972642 RepID=UPI003464C8D0
MDRVPASVLSDAAAASPEPPQPGSVIYQDTLQDTVLQLLLEIDPCLSENRNGSIILLMQEVLHAVFCSPSLRVDIREVDRLRAEDRMISRIAHSIASELREGTTNSQLSHRVKEKDKVLFEQICRSVIDKVLSQAPGNASVRHIDPVLDDNQLLGDLSDLDEDRLSSTSDQSDFEHENQIKNILGTLLWRLCPETECVGRESLCRRLDLKYKLMVQVVREIERLPDQEKFFRKHRVLRMSCLQEVQQALKVKHLSVDALSEDPALQQIVASTIACKLLSSAQPLPIKLLESGEASSTSNESLVSSTSNESLVSSTSNESLASSTSIEPLASSTSNEPLASSTSNEPLASSTSNEPLASSTSSVPLASVSQSEIPTADLLPQPGAAALVEGVEPLHIPTAAEAPGRTKLPMMKCFRRACSRFFPRLSRMFCSKVAPM